MRAPSDQRDVHAKHNKHNSYYIYIMNHARLADAHLFMCITKV